MCLNQKEILKEGACRLKVTYKWILCLVAALGLAVATYCVGYLNGSAETISVYGMIVPVAISTKLTRGEYNAAQKKIAPALRAAMLTGLHLRKWRILMRGQVKDSLDEGLSRLFAWQLLDSPQENISGDDKTGQLTKEVMEASREVFDDWCNQLGSESVKNELRGRIECIIKEERQKPASAQEARTGSLSTIDK